jgi:hypothetical protein
MTYKLKLLPWCIVRRFPNSSSQVIIRFRRRNDAEAHLQILKGKNPSASYEVFFDITSESTDLTGKQALLQFQTDVD